MNVLDLFSGIGGFSLGLERAGMRTVAFCEIESYARAVLATHWPDVPRYDDVRTLSAERLERDGIAVDVICGGFPCQDVSSSGPRQGLAGKKSGLWFEYSRLIRELRPRYVIVENVADLLHRGLGVVLGDLAACGYDAEWRCVPASVTGLPQTRDRMWIVANPCGWRRQAGDERQPIGSQYFRWADDDRLGEAQLAAQASAARAWRSDDGFPRWVDRMRGLGNAVVPQIPEAIGRAIMSKICPTCEGTGSVVSDDEIGGFQPPHSDREPADECADCGGTGHSKNTAQPALSVSSNHHQPAKE